MISSIYFKDGSMECFNVNTKGNAPRIVTGVEGLSRAMRIIQTMHIDGINWALFTNDPLLVDDAKDVARLGYDDVYIWDVNKKEFVVSTDLTPKELRNSNIFSRLWLGDVFENSKSII